MANKKKTKNYTNILLLIVILLLAVFLYNQYNEKMSFVDSETQEELNTPAPIIPTECTLSISTETIEEGEEITGTIHDGANTLCAIYTNFNSEGWKFLTNVNTNNYGYYSQTVNPEYAGTYELKAICGSCITNSVTLTVTPYDWSDGEEYTPFVVCEGIELPQYGDLGALCAVGDCEDESCVCSHYWDYLNQIQMCGCTETSYCGQYCYEYLYTNGCECPPNSIRETVTRSTFRCVPEGYYCENGLPIAEVGPFPN